MAMTRKEYDVAASNIEEIMDSALVGLNNLLYKVKKGFEDDEEFESFIQELDEQIDNVTIFKLPHWPED